MQRCYYCHRFVWFFQRQGWFIVNVGSPRRWHSACYRREVAR